jgi:hypothetical protein
MIDGNIFFGGMIFGIALTAVAIASFVLGTRFTLERKKHAQAEERQGHGLFERRTAVGEAP